ncbi:heme-binding protein 2 [Bombina bombina]|uniref:heme-binding protein 2 n=1 Tax=Bombina bombina TaxID=8345 RepID=UPI00235A57E1|nr:heme-binding protein 2 [Bombina bombina]
MKGAGALFVLSLLSLYGNVIEAEEGNTENAPDFCGKNECPKYQVAKQYNTFELRVYEATNWVSTDMEEDFLGYGKVKSFRHLFGYISGKNSQGIKIPMTVPVNIYIPLKRPSPTNATMSFFLPPSLSPPAPTDPDVYLQSVPEKSVYVKSFTGYAFQNDYLKKAKALSEELVALGLSFDDSSYTSAGYNDPFTLFKRHNEVWLTAQ